MNRLPFLVMALGSAISLWLYLHGQGNAFAAAALFGSLFAILERP